MSTNDSNVLNSRPAQQTHKVVNVQKVDWCISAAVILAYLCLSVANCQACRRISLDRSYILIQHIRQTGLHVYNAVFCVIMLFVETKITICRRYLRYLTNSIVIRIFVASTIIAITISERNLGVFSLGMLSAIGLAALVFTQVVLRCIFSEGYQMLEVQAERPPEFPEARPKQYGSVPTDDIEHIALKKPQSAWVHEPRFNIEAVEFTDDEEDMPSWVKEADK